MAGKLAYFAVAAAFLVAPFACTDNEETTTASSSSASGCVTGCGGEGQGGSPPGCGDSTCAEGETCENCEGDCGSCDCGDGDCDENELCGTCEADCGACTGPAVNVIRGPYLQSGGSDRVTVRWRTAEPTASAVAFGPSAIALTTVVKSAEVSTEHELELTGLSPDTKYIYGFGAPESTLLGGDADHFVLSAPTAARPTRIWVIGDAGTANSEQAAVRDAYLTFTGTRGTDLWLMLGDNAYDDGTDSEFQAAVFDMYPTVLRNSVVWPTLGNHDGHTADSGSQSGPYYDIFSLPREAQAGGTASGTEAYYSFNYGNIHFVCLDSYDSDTEPAGDMLTWLQSDLAANTQPWLIAFWHHPPYSKGSHDSDDEGQLIDMRVNALPILESHGVDLVLTGHSHSYERSYYLNGHYGDSSTLAPSMLVDDGDGSVSGDGAYSRTMSSMDGAVYVVAGSSGQTSGGSLDHPAMFISLNELGSLVIDVDGLTMDVSFIDEVATVRDQFTIQKQ